MPRHMNSSVKVTWRMAESRVRTVQSSLIILLAFTHEPSGGSLLPVEVIHFSPNSETQRMTNPSISFYAVSKG